EPRRRSGSHRIEGRRRHLPTLRPWIVRSVGRRAHPSSMRPTLSGTAHARRTVRQMATMASSGESSDGSGPKLERRRRATRYVPVVLGLLIAVGVLGGLKGAQISTVMAAGKRSKQAGPPPETVNTFVAQEQSWDQTLDTVGSIAPAR